jgi:putative membrane protein
VPQPTEAFAHPQRRGLLVLMLAMTAGALVPLAGLGWQRSAATGEPVPVGDHRFVYEAAALARGGLDAARLAEQRAVNSEVRVFAARMAAEEAALLDELTAFGKSRGIELADGPSVERRAALEALGRLGGDAFDRQFVQQIGREDHQTRIDFYEFAAGTVSDGDLKAWIERALPRLRERLAAALQLPTLVIA